MESDMGKDPERRSLTLGVISEVHHVPPDTANIAWHNELRFDLGLQLLDAAISQLSKHQLDYVVLLGDLTHFSNEASLAAVADRIRSIDTPILVVPGNHDVTIDSANSVHFTETLADAGATVAPWQGTIAGTHATLLSIERDEQNHSLRSTAPELSPAVDQPTLVMSHYPLLDLTATLAAANLAHAGDLTDRPSLEQALLRSNSPIVVFHGHLHVRASSVRDNLLHLSFAALIEPPHECSIVTIEALSSGEFTVNRQALEVAPYDVESLPVLSPGPERWRCSNGSWSLMTS